MVALVKTMLNLHEDLLGAKTRLRKKDRLLRKETYCA